MTMKMKRFLYIALVALTAAGLTTGCRKKAHASAEEVPAVDVARAFCDSVTFYKTYPGYLSARNRASVVAQVNGKILQKHYTPGARVERGQLLFSIDPTLYRNAVSRAEAALASAVSTRDYAARHYDAVKKALEADAVSKMEVLSAKSALDQAEADIRDCTAALSTARTNLGYCSVAAPISGYISDSDFTPGNYVSGEASPVKLCEIYDNSELMAVFDIEESQYEKMIGGAVGAPERQLLRSIPLQFREHIAHAYTADLTYQAPSVSTSTGTVQLKGTVANIDNELKDGMYVTVSLPFGVDPRAVLVSDASIGTDQRGKYVYLVSDSNRVVYTPVETGELFRDSLRVITKGVDEGNLYVTKALLTVRNGERVNPRLE